MTDSLREAATMALSALDCGAMPHPEHESLCACAIESLRAALALPDAEPVAWKITYTPSDGSLRTVVHGHNAIGDYRVIDPDATSTPLYAAHNIQGAA